MYTRACWTLLYLYPRILICTWKQVYVRKHIYIRETLPKEQLMRVGVCVLIHVDMCIRTWSCVYKTTYTCTCESTHIYIRGTLPNEQLLNVCMCVCIYAFIYTWYTYTICIHAHSFMYENTCIHACHLVYTTRSMRMCVRVYVWYLIPIHSVYTHTHIYANTYMHAWEQIYMYVTPGPKNSFCVCACVCLCLTLIPSVYTRTDVYTRTHTCTYENTCNHTWHLIWRTTSVYICVSYLILTYHLYTPTHSHSYTYENTWHK